MRGIAMTVRTLPRLIARQLTPSGWVAVAIVITIIVIIAGAIR